MDSLLEVSPECSLPSLPQLTRGLGISLDHQGSPVLPSPASGQLCDLGQASVPLSVRRGICDFRSVCICDLFNHFSEALFSPRKKNLPNGLKVAYKYAYEAVIEKRRSKAKGKQIKLGIRLQHLSWATTCLVFLRVGHRFGSKLSGSQQQEKNMINYPSHSFHTEEKSVIPCRITKILRIIRPNKGHLWAAH